MSKRLSGSLLKFMLGLLAACWASSSAEALRQGSAPGNASYNCSLNFGSCACDGTYENCNAMEKNCKDQKVACTIINDQRICTCLMATETDAAGPRR
jgi:hypothetical protein